MAILINRVYTRSGDKGQTSLVGGIRVEKDCQKLESYGTVDELICLVGTARTVLDEKKNGLPLKVVVELEKSLRRIQSRLFDVGSILATPAGQIYSGMPELNEDDSRELEREMDRMQKSLQPLKSFVLPGGSMANALLHQCRAVCRRAERDILRLAKQESVDGNLIKYMNRLSDLFFVMSRYASHMAQVQEYLWEYGSMSPKQKNAAKAAKSNKAKKRAKTN